MSPEKRESRWPARLQPSLSLSAKLAAILFSILFGESAFAQSSVTLAWNPSADATVVGYRLYQGGASQSYTNHINAGNLTSRTVSGLAAGATYFFAATSYNSSGVESDYSNEISYTVPGAPGGSPVPASSVTLAWNPSADATAVGYRLYQGGASQSYTNNINVGSLTTKTVSGLAAGATYYFAATSYNSSGVESDYSNEISYTVPAPAPAVTGCAKLATGNFTLSSSGAPHQTCVLLAATNLTPPVVWTPIATNTANAQGLINFTDPMAGNYARRYYRIRAY